MIRWRSIVVLLFCLLASAEARLPPLEPLDRPLNPERFLGDWYAIGSIRIRIPFFSDVGAHNAIENFQRLEEDRLLCTYTFHKDSLDAPRKRYRLKVKVANPGINTDWTIQLIWPFRSSFMILYMADDYQHTVVGVPSRRWAWILSRQPTMAPERYSEMVAVLDAAGFDASKVERVPQQWPGRFPSD